MEQAERMERIREFLEEHPNDPFLNHALALEYVKRGEDMMARTLFEKIVALEPGYIGSYYHLGRLLEREERYRDAAEVYRNGIMEARKVNDFFSIGELSSALEALDLDNA